MNIRSIIHRVLMIPINSLESRIKKTNWYRNSIPNIDNYPGDRWYRNHLDRNYDVVNLGSSSAVFCFDYDGLDVKAFNWALKPQSMEYSFKVLKQYFSILRQNGIVLIPFSPFSGLSVTGKWAECANDKYYHILDRALIDNYESVAKRRQHPFLSMPLHSIKRLINDVQFCNMYSYNIQCKSKEEFEKSAKSWINFWMKEFNIEDLNAPLSKENLEGGKSRLNMMKEMIFFCQERDLEPIFILPPVHESLNRYFTPEFVRNYIISFFKELNTSEIKILNYLANPKFTRDEYFRDAYFMNEEGAKVFTIQVLSDIELIPKRS